jgi:tetraprenyl-beta-curcumene synthase
MVGMKPLRIPNPRDALALLTTGIAYWLTIAPTARSELRRWKRYARKIPDPVLRGHALEKLSNEALNPEAAAFFAVLAPKTSRPRLIRLIVAYQAMYDYLDAVNEEPAFSPLRDGLQLHRALLDTVQSRQTSTDYYTHHPQHDDGGYLNALANTCRDALDAFPSTAAVTPALIAAAKRCGEAQARNHAVPVEDYDQLIRWSEKQAPGSGYLWWELAAAGISCLAIHALFAAAATPKTTPREAQRIDGAYFPAVCAISALLDSLIDLPHDAYTANHSFAAHYTSSGHAAKRYAAIIADAEEQLGGLRHSRRHRIILAGITGYYLSAPEANGDFAHPVTVSAIGAARPMIWLILAIMRVRRWGHNVALSQEETPLLRCKRIDMDQVPGLFPPSEYSPHGLSSAQDGGIDAP